MDPNVVRWFCLVNAEELTAAAYAAIIDGGYWKPGPTPEAARISSKVLVVMWAGQGGGAAHLFFGPGLFSVPRVYRVYIYLRV